MLYFVGATLFILILVATATGYYEFQRNRRGVIIYPIHDSSYHKELIATYSKEYQRWVVKYATTYLLILEDNGKAHPFMWRPIKESTCKIPFKPVEPLF